MTGQYDDRFTDKEMVNRIKETDCHVIWKADPDDTMFWNLHVFAGNEGMSADQLHSVPAEDLRKVFVWAIGQIAKQPRLDSY